MPSPLVSVVIPAYNHAAYLTETIRSALNQTFRDFEVVVVDDGSSDDTPDVAASFGEEIRYIRQANSGMAGSRNTGIQAARGQFIGFLDDDDLWEPTYLAEVMSIMQSDHEIAACYVGVQIIDGDGELLSQVSTKTVLSGTLYDVLIDGGFFPPSTVTVRKTCLNEVGLFDRNLQGYADWDMWLRISRRFRIVGIPRVLVRYRVHHGGLSSNVEHMFEDNMRAAAKHFGPPEGPVSQWPILRRRAYASAYFAAALSYFQRNDRKAAREYLTQAFCIYPDLSSRLDVFYELACGNQPRGWRGQFLGYDFETNRTTLLESLDLIFYSEETGSELVQVRNTAYGNAHLALGLLAYGSGRMADSRRHFLKAVRYHPTLAREPQVASRWLKSLLGDRVLNDLRKRFGNRALSTG